MMPPPTHAAGGIVTFSPKLWAALHTRGYRGLFSVAQSAGQRDKQSAATFTGHGRPVSVRVFGWSLQGTAADGPVPNVHASSFEVNNLSRDQSM